MRGALAAALLCAAGCASTTTEVRPLPASGYEISTLCIERNPDVVVEDFLSVIEQGVARHGIAARVIDPPVPADCDYTLWYTARRRWDIRPVLGSQVSANAQAQSGQAPAPAAPAPETPAPAAEAPAPQNRPFPAQEPTVPPAEAPHSWAGFSTGSYDGNMLTIRTTHLKSYYYRRNGVPASDKEAADRLGVSFHTVRQYVKSLYRALHVQSRTELLARFIPRDQIDGVLGGSSRPRR